MSNLETYIGPAGIVIETLGVVCIIAGFILSSAWFIARLRHGSAMDAYNGFRKDLGRSIMLGLEFLIAGDIIRTIIVEQTLTSAATLAVIVAIRIVLSLSLEYELEDRTPWKREKT